MQHILTDPQWLQKKKERKKKILGLLVLCFSDLPEVLHFELHWQDTFFRLEISLPIKCSRAKHPLRQFSFFHPAG